MSSMFVIPNLIYSGNPFLISRVYDIVNESDKNLLRKTIMNVKYWYASMPDECKKILHTLIQNDTFKIRKGTHLRIHPSEVLKRGLYRPIGVQSIKPTGINPHEARSYSEALERVDRHSISWTEGDEYSLIDTQNDFVFRVTTKTVSIIDPEGNDIVVLTVSEKHALIIYGAIRGIQKVKDNMEAWEKVRYQESLKDKILEVYNAK